MGTTMKDIAKALNISVATVSKVMNNKKQGASEETRQKILSMAKELDYHPNRIARGLVTKKTNTIGLILPDINNPFFPNLVRGAEDACNRLNYGLILCNTDDDSEKENKYIYILKEKCVDGIIYTGSVKNDCINVNLMKRLNIPFVLLDRSYKVDKVPKVYTNGTKDIYALVNILIEGGHKKIAYISGPKDTMFHEQRFRGYIKAIEDNNIEMDESRIVYGQYKIESGYNCMYKLLERNNNFSAVVCENDLLAIGAMQALNEKNIKIPEEISITGYDDIYISSLVSPKLTTVHQPTYDMGKIAAEILVEWIENEVPTDKEIILESKIILRDSVKKK